MKESCSYQQAFTDTEFNSILPNTSENSNQQPNSEFGLESFTDSERYWEKNQKNYTVIKHRFAASIKFVNRMFRGKSNIRLPKLTCAFLDFLLNCDRTQRNGEAKNSQGYFKAGWTNLTHKKVAKFLGCSLPTATSILVNCRAIRLITQAVDSLGKYWYKLNLKAYENLLASPLEFVQGIIGLFRKTEPLSPTLSEITALSSPLSNSLLSETTTLSSGLSDLPTPITTLSPSEIVGVNPLSPALSLSESLSVISDNSIFSGFTYKNLYATYKFLYPESALNAYAASLSILPLNIIYQYQDLINNKFVCKNLFFLKEENFNEKRQQGGGWKNDYGEGGEDKINDGKDQGEVLITGKHQATQFKQGGQRAFRVRTKRIRTKRRFKRVQNICVRNKLKLIGDLAGCVATGGLFDCQNEGLDREVKINPDKEQIILLKVGFEKLYKQLYDEMNELNNGRNEMGVAIAPMKSEGLHRNTFREMLKYPVQRVAISLCYSFLRVEKGCKYIANIDGFITQALRKWDDWKENINLDNLAIEFNGFIEDINFVLGNVSKKQNTSMPVHTASIPSHEKVEPVKEKLDIVLEFFHEWFHLARSKGLVVASTNINEVLHVCIPGGRWIPFETMFSQYPLESLKA